MVGTGADTFRHTRARLRRRSVVVTTLLGMAAAALAVVTMMVGDTALSAGEVLGSVLGFAEDAAVDFVVWELRLPGAATALFVGLALGAAGLIVQTLLANPLASPDLIGISSGAGLFAVTAIVLLQVGALAVAGAAVAGAVVAAVLIYVLAWRGGLTGYRFILVGIGITQLMTALIGWVLAKAEIGDARQAMTWLVGSVGQAGSVQLRLLAGAVAVLLPVALLSARALRVLQLGDDGARGLGIRVETARSAMIGVSVLLVAFSVAAAGPLAFVALTAGPIAVRLLRGSGTGVLAAAFVGAIIVLAADLVAAHGLPVSLPTGVVTGAVGAPYLIWLLTTVNREGRGG
ncbi:FecCD family ABC transporter permease [Mycolicibacterium tokaiense]|uniref:Ferric enterobactin ABC transporter, permease protein FepG n=1 Tax=Mycolicibacterium tokaiense TaxID=39695 RepID=A0A378T6V1_9MYCO|nr:iron chelate uptake ABC transporter family permease subunit [Mycolicibacterium tokaiense]BBY88949.1 iron ABC transporter permease [Mycolicibacterium tokaiense]STZ56528.1 Ferric enterobactin ABC transporter, permease protein FepG [Mycolicibacterium tokaiense]